MEVIVGGLIIVAIVAIILKNLPDSPAPVNQSPQDMLNNAKTMREMRNVELGGQVSEDQLLAQQANWRAERAAADEATSRRLDKKTYLEMESSDAYRTGQLKEKEIQMYMDLEKRREEYRLQREHEYLAQQQRLEFQRLETLALIEKEKLMIEAGLDVSEKKTALERKNAELQRENTRESYRDKIRSAAEAREERKRRAREE